MQIIRESFFIILKLIAIFFKSELLKKVEYSKIYNKELRNINILVKLCSFHKKIIIIKN